MPPRQGIGLGAARFDAVAHRLGKRGLQSDGLLVRLLPVGARHPGLAPVGLGPLRCITPLRAGLLDIDGVPVGPPDLRHLSHGDPRSQLMYVDHHVDGVELVLEVGDLSLQQLALSVQVREHVSACLIKDCLDVGQAHAGLPVDEDLLDAHDVRLAVEPVAGGTALGGMHQAGLVPVMQRPDADAQER